MPYGNADSTRHCRRAMRDPAPCLSRFRLPVWPSSTDSSSPPAPVVGWAGPRPSSPTPTAPRGWPGRCPCWTKGAVPQRSSCWERAGSKRSWTCHAPRGRSARTGRRGWVTPFVMACVCSARVGPMPPWSTSSTCRTSPRRWRGGCSGERWAAAPFDGRCTPGGPVTRCSSAVTTGRRSSPSSTATGGPRTTCGGATPRPSSAPTSRPVRTSTGLRREGGGSGRPGPTAVTPRRPSAAR